MAASLRESYAYCRHVARHRARNFYYSFLLLAKPQRDAMCAVYAFMRYSDDLSDDPDLSNHAAMDRWRADLERALTGDYGTHLAWPALHDAIQRYRIPHQYLREMIDGVSSDLEARHFQTYEELRHYCHQVAGVVGLTTIHIFGFNQPEALPLAEACGLAFQLTNILRDIREDLERGRIYLPHEDLERFGVTVEDLRRGLRDERTLGLLRFEAARARDCYREAQPLIGMVAAPSRPSLSALIGIYRRLLEHIEASNFDVFERRIRLPAWEKADITLRALIRGR